MNPRNVGSDVRNVNSTFNDSYQKQRAALLHVKNSGSSAMCGLSSTTNNLIYILFGEATVNENFNFKNYTGWVVAYTSTSSGLQFAFAYSDEPTSCGSGGGINSFLQNGGQCADAPPQTNNGSPACDCYLTNNSGSPPNWGGHAAGCWMSGNGPAATTATGLNGDNSVHTFFGCGNGGFQKFTDSTNNNYGEAMMDFRLTQSTCDSTEPFQSFVPKTPLAGVAPALANDCGCNGATCSQHHHTQ